MADLVRWTLYNQATATTWTFEINPNSMTMPGVTKTITYKAAAAPNGNVLAFEGRDTVNGGSFTGTILTEQQYNDLLEWSNLRHQVTLTDDLGRGFQIYITQLQINRVFHPQRPWYHTYTLNFILIDWA